MTTAGQEGLALVESKNFAAALPKLNRALESSQAPGWLLARSKCHIALKSYTAALRDAEAAYRAASARGSRNIMTDAQYRRAVALFRLGRIADADLCAHWSMKLAEGLSVSDPVFVADPVGSGTSDWEGGYWRPDKEALMERVREVTSGGGQAAMTEKKFGAIWNTAVAVRTQAIGRLDKLDPKDEARKIKVAFVPPEVKDDDADAEEDELLQQALAEKKKNEEAAKNQPPKPVRVDFFQSNTNVSVSVFAKNVPKNLFQHDISEDKVLLSHIPGHEGWFEIPLYGRIVPSESKCNVTPNKVELSLRKAELVKWKALRRDTNTVIPAAPVAAAAAPPAAPTNIPVRPVEPAEADKDKVAKPEPEKPNYPTSSRHGPKNWDKVVDDEVEDGEDKEGVNDFFKTLYAGATEEQKRAMIKSFTESNGTSLSTNWEDVKSKKVETAPPEGVDVKKWEA